MENTFKKKIKEENRANKKYRKGIRKIISGVLTFCIAFFGIRTLGLTWPLYDSLISTGLGSALHIILTMGLSAFGIGKAVHGSIMAAKNSKIVDELNNDELDYVSDLHEELDDVKSDNKELKETLLNEKKRSKEGLESIKKMLSKSKEDKIGLLEVEKKEEINKEIEDKHVKQKSI